MINSLAQASLGRVTHNLQSFYQLRMNRIHRFRPKIELQSELGPFEIKTVSSVSELKAALSLRYDVFHKELLGKKNTLGMDVDAFDFNCDHLIVKLKKTAEVVATYRINCSLFTDNFSSSKEFILANILKLPGVKIEMGRFCIHKNYRHGILNSLLWRGVAEYMAASDAKFVFGCSTVKTDDPRDAALLTRYFEEEKRMATDFRARPTLPFTMPLLNYFLMDLPGPLNDSQKNEAVALLPEMFCNYIKVGAYVGGEPAWDRDLKSMDFLAILKREDLNKALWSKQVEKRDEVQFRN